MVNAERLCLDEADTGGVPWRRWGRGEGGLASVSDGRTRAER